MHRSVLLVKKVLIISVTLFVISVCHVAASTMHEASANSKPVLYWGKTGYQVTKVQQRLANWGYYKGSVDGVFGSKTYAAVEKFQKFNGLRRDGVVGPQTWAALGYQVASIQPAAVPAVSRAGLSNNGRVNLLARVIEGEAADEPFIGKVAVGAVILNRIRSAAFPNTLSGIVYQPLAFESVSNGQYNRPLSQEAIKAANLAINGWDPTGGALFFWNPSKKVSAWIWSRPIITRIGRHVFAR